MESDPPHLISIVNRTGRRTPTSLIRKAVSSALSLHDARPGEISILLCEDEEIQALNRQFRYIDEPTDVLTFPANHPQLLGDIAISVPYAERQAAARGVSLNQEIGFLAIHGALHLLGFEDESEDDRRVMVQEMNRAAALAGLQPDHQWASILHEATAR